ncbi:Phosphoglycerate mutase-like protein AT74 [Glycine soja]|uniref:Uncharacterized protein n=2 Tax=Glycine subgen. Soja TaxID=1462606 RepID=A0A0R0KTU4_SOYBN|nr:Putative phosphoglycerate mutase DET1 [Glycine soja]RZC22252.1 Phosphoglycerate mutase-like protein AT74 [Glycine soja]
MIIGVREECRIREQDLCNFQVINETRQRFGRFFFRRRFLESLWRDVDMNRLNHHPSDDLDLIIVSHGLASRVFLMKWFKWTVEQFELLNNFGNGEFRVIQLGVVEIGEYSLAVHHTDEELLEWGLSPDMVADQKRRASAGKGDWNDQYSWYLDAFFYHLPDSDDENVDKHDETDSLSECS